MGGSGGRDGGGLWGGLKFEGSLRSTCEVSNGDVLLRDTLSSSQEETM